MIGRLLSSPPEHSAKVGCKKLCLGYSFHSSHLEVEGKLRLAARLEMNLIMFKNTMLKSYVFIL